MSEDAPGNPGAVAWPDDFTASVMVRRMQIKLHHWAGADSSCRFGDLFNLVYDPAFLVHAWERVASNAGARTPGVDKATVAWIESRIGVEGFLGQIRGLLKSGEFRPAEVRQVMIPKNLFGNLYDAGRSDVFSGAGEIRVTGTLFGVSVREFRERGPDDRDLCRSTDHLGPRILRVRPQCRAGAVPAASAAVPGSRGTPRT